MSRRDYRHTIRILRRAEDPQHTGGYVGDVYFELAVTSAGVRDESEAEYAAAESAQIEHVKTFAMRARDIRDDDVIVWHKEHYRVRRVDRYDNNGREIRVRASLARSRYTVVEAAHGGNQN